VEVVIIVAQYDGSDLDDETEAAATAASTHVEDSRGFDSEKGQQFRWQLVISFCLL
jgi:hypothetical protein